MDDAAENPAECGPRPLWPLVPGLLLLQLLTFVGASHDSGTAVTLDVLAMAMGLVSVPFLVRTPVQAAVVLGLVAALSPVATPAATAAVFVVAQLRPFRTAAAVAAVGIAGHLVLASWRPVESLPFVWWAVLVVVAYGLLVGWGAYVQARRALLASLRERARQAEATQSQRVAEARRLERHRIAREMHDVLAHRLSLVATHAGALEYRPDSSPERIATAAGVVRAGVHQALDELREVILVLRDEDEGGDPATRPQPTLADLPALVEESRAVGVSVELVGAGRRPGRPSDPRPSGVPRGPGRADQRPAPRAWAAGPGGGAVRPGDCLEVRVTNPSRGRAARAERGRRGGPGRPRPSGSLSWAARSPRRRAARSTLCARLPWAREPETHRRTS